MEPAANKLRRGGLSLPFAHVAGPYAGKDYYQDHNYENPVCNTEAKHIQISLTVSCSGKVFTPADSPAGPLPKNGKKPFSSMNLQ
jgi:hypothetical protein